METVEIKNNQVEILGVKYEIKDDFVIELMNKDIHCSLVGGAMVDILEGRRPKDYDFAYISKNSIKNLGFVFVRDTSTATTYRRGETVLQVLKTRVEDFDFTISQTKTSFGQSETNISIDVESFGNKTLIPVSYDKIGSIKALSRIPHWSNKGYSINDCTYMSLIGVVRKSLSYSMKDES